MASFFITASSTTAQTLAAGETGFVAASGTLYVATATAVTLTGGAAHITAMGTVATGTGVAAVRSSGTLDSASVTVGQNGAILSTTSDAIRLSVSGNTRVTNDGLIAGETGVYVSGTAGTGVFTLQNTGDILSNQANAFSGVAAVYATAETYRTVISNSGNIRSVDNTYAIVAHSTGGTQITNSGTIGGNDYAIYVRGGLTLRNTGEILGTIDFYDGASIRNSGTIIGGMNGSSGSVSLRNTGQIIGDVVLSSASDTFINAGGRIMGLVNGGAGNDTYTLDSPDVRISDGSGALDTVYASFSYRMDYGIDRLFLNDTTGLGLVGTGGDGAETIVGDGGADTLLGLAGNDSLAGAEGDDLLKGGHGDDSLAATSGDDVIYGGIGNDTLRVHSGTIVADGGAGNDLIEVDWPMGAQIDLTARTITGLNADGDILLDVALRAVEHARGSAGADTITGSGGHNRLDGYLGADVIAGGGGNDTIIGNSGADTMSGGPGFDTFEFQFTSHSAPGASDLILAFERPRDVIDLSRIDADVITAGDQAYVWLGNGAFTGVGPELRYSVDAVAGTTLIEIRNAGSVSNTMEIRLDTAVNLLVDNFIL